MMSAMDSPRSLESLAGQVLCTAVGHPSALGIEVGQSVPVETFDRHVGQVAEQIATYGVGGVCWFPSCPEGDPPGRVAAWTARLREAAGPELLIATDQEGGRVARMREGLTTRQVVSRNPGFVGSNFVVRAATYRAVGGFDPALRVSNDQDLLLRLLEHGATYRVVPEVTLVNRIHSGPQLTDKTELRARAVLDYYHKHRALMGWRDRIVIATVVAGIRRVSAPTAVRRVQWTLLTAVGRGCLLLLRAGRGGAR